MKEILDHTTIKANLSVEGVAFVKGADIGNARVTSVANPTAATDAVNKQSADTTYVPKTDVIIGPVANLPATLAPGQIYYGY